ncbi:MAG: hypothetical protein GXO32_02810 [Crenarchaeota archaeon]|nr:hypothetical protein [Thermoproteota archaeon]
MALEDVARTVDALYRNIGAVLKGVSGEGRAKRMYRDLLSDIQSTLALVKRFLELAHCIERALGSELRARVCHRWFLTRNDGVVTLVKLEPRVTIYYDGSRIRITYDDREVEFEGGTTLRFRVNNFRDEVDLRNEDAVLEKRSLIREAIGRIKSIITHCTPDMELCIKEYRLRC